MNASQDSMTPTTTGDVIYPSPTVRLPRITAINETPIQDLLSSVVYLRSLYNPEVRGTRRRISVRPAGDSHTDYLKDNIKAIRSDAFERSYAIRWLTALIARSDTLSLTSDDNEETSRAELIENAASLLAACAGTASSGRLTRNFTFENGTSKAKSGCQDSENDIKVQLVDAPLENGDYGTLGAQTWGAACVLAEMIVESPGEFGIPDANITEKQPMRNDSVDTDFDPSSCFRVLELGAGTGLVGLAIAKLLESRRVKSEVYLSDFHSSVLANLRANTESNFGNTENAGASTSVDVRVVKLDWEECAKNEDRSSIQGLGSFDIILGADIVYETLHAEWLRICVERLLLRAPQSTFHLLIPLRRTHTAESETVKTVFQNYKETKDDAEAKETFKLGIVHEEHFVCDVDDNGLDEVEYVYYRIGWSRI